MHEFIMYVTKGTSGKFIGHVKELPEIVVQADTAEGLDLEATKSVSLLFEHYPELHDKLFPYEAPHQHMKELYRNATFQHKTVEVRIK